MAGCQNQLPATLVASIYHELHALNCKEMAEENSLEEEFSTSVARQSIGIAPSQLPLSISPAFQRNHVSVPHQNEHPAKAVVADKFVTPNHSSFEEDDVDVPLTPAGSNHSVSNSVNNLNSTKTNIRNEIDAEIANHKAKEQLSLPLENNVRINWT